MMMTASPQSLTPTKNEIPEIEGVVTENEGGEIEGVDV